MTRWLAFLLLLPAATFADPATQRVRFETTAGDFVVEQITVTTPTLQKLTRFGFANVSIVVGDDAVAGGGIGGSLTNGKGAFIIFPTGIAGVLSGDVSLNLGASLSGDVFLAEQGSGSYRNGARLRVSEVQRLEEACVEVDFSTIHDRRAFVSRAVNVMRQAGQIRCLGAAVGGICQVATGDADGYLHMSLYPWDYAAAQLIAEEAGAMATRLDGSPLRVFDGREGVLVTNGAVHDAVLGLITP